MNQVNQSEVEDQEIQWVTFRMEHEVYGITVMQVQEVLRVSEITPVPGAPQFVLGIINLRGNVVTVLDTRKRFGLPPKELDDSSRVIIIESGDQVIGIMVDSVAEVVYIKLSEIEKSPNVGNEENSKFIQGVYSKDSNLIILVDVNKMLSDEEWKDLADV